MHTEGSRGVRAQNGHGGSSSGGERVITYCIVPADLADALHEFLRKHFADDPTIKVVVERREREHRRESRRETSAPETLREERRVLRSAAGRRVGDRRVETVAAEVPRQLPRRARRHAARLVFARRVEPTGERARDRDTERLILRSQAGDRDALGELYTRYFDDVYRYALVALGDRHEAEDIVQQVFIKVLGALPRYEVRPETPFQAWLFHIARNTVLNALPVRDRLRPEDPGRVERRREMAMASHANPAAEVLTTLGWITDHDLSIFVMRLPVAQRQALAMRYLFEMSTEEIANSLNRSPAAVRTLIHRGLRSLEDRLGALGQAPAKTSRAPMLVRIRKATVLRGRRFALVGTIRPPDTTASRAAMQRYC